MFHREGNFFWGYSRDWLSSFFSSLDHLRLAGNLLDSCKVSDVHYDEIGKCKCEDCSRLCFQRLTQQYLSLYMLFLPCELACLHQEVESNSSPLQSGHLLGICFYHRIQKWHWSWSWSLKWTLAFQMLPLGACLCRTGLPCWDKPMHHKESLPCRCSSWSQPLNHSGPSARHRSEDSSRCLQSLDNAVIS